MNTVLITGANRGIGLGLVKAYLQAGWQVIASCRSPEQALDLAQLAENTGNRLRMESLIGSREEGGIVRSRVAELNKTCIDLLINNAGVFTDKQSDGSLTPLGELDSESLLGSFEINAMTPLLLTQALLPALEKGKLRTVINISSTLGSIGRNQEGGMYAYRASKAALNAITKSLSIDLKRKGFVVVSIHPGWVRTDMGGKNAEISVEESARNLCNVIAGLTANDTGAFLTYSGNKLEW